MVDPLLFGRLADARRARPLRFRLFNAHLDEYLSENDVKSRFRIGRLHKLPCWLVVRWSSEKHRFPVCSSESMGAYHSTKNSGANFRKFPWANGTVFFQCGDHNCSPGIFQWLLGLNHKYRSKQNTDKSTSWLFINHKSRDLAQTTTAAKS